MILGQIDGPYFYLICESLHFFAKSIFAHPSSKAKDEAMLGHTADGNGTDGLSGNVSTWVHTRHASCPSTGHGRRAISCACSSTVRSKEVRECASL